MKTSGNTILITGGTSGIGLELAEQLQARGNTVVVAGRRREALAEITARNPEIDSVELDLADPASIERAVATTIERHPDLNVLINSGGIITWERFEDPEHLAEAERTVATNLLGPIQLIAALLPHFLERERAAIVTVTSGLAFVPLHKAPSYSASKAAVHAYTACLRGQLAATGVEVVEIVPPSVNTPMHGGEPNERAMPVGQYVDEVLEILERTPPVDEVCVPNVEFLRFAEARGTYADASALINGS